MISASVSVKKDLALDFTGCSYSFCSISLDVWGSCGVMGSSWTLTREMGFGLECVGSCSFLPSSLVFDEISTSDFFSPSILCREDLRGDDVDASCAFFRASCFLIFSFLSPLSNPWPFLLQALVAHGSIVLHKLEHPMVVVLPIFSPWHSKWIVWGLRVHPGKCLALLFSCVLMLADALCSLRSKAPMKSFLKYAFKTNLLVYSMVTPPVWVGCPKMLRVQL